MAVLCDIKQMAGNPKFGYNCIKSKDKIGEWLDLSRATVFNAIKTLELKGYIERNEVGIRPTQFIYDLSQAQEEIGLYVKNGELEMITKVVSELLDGPSKNYTPTVQNLDSDRLKIRLRQSKIYTQEEQLENTDRNTNRIVAIETRKQVFLETLKPYISKYGQEMINRFYDYWTETNESGKKFRQESEKFWDLPKRLATWHSRNQKFVKTEPQQPKLVFVNGRLSK